jgi:hypothetical protein
MINKYIELHNELIDLLVTYHNAHLNFVKRPSAYSMDPVIRTTAKMSRALREIKRYNRILRPVLLDQKRKHVENKRAKKEARKNERLNRTNENRT